MFRTAMFFKEALLVRGILSVYEGISAASSLSNAPFAQYVAWDLLLREFQGFVSHLTPSFRYDHVLRLGEKDVN